MALSLMPIRCAKGFPDRATRMLKAGCLLLCSLPGSQSASAQELLQLNFGIFSANKPSAMVTLFKPALQAIEDGMEQELERPVEIRLQIAGNLEESVAALTNGLFDFTRLQPAGYVSARRVNRDIRLLAAEQVDDAERVFGIIAVRANADITSVTQLDGKSFAFGDEGSTIGRYLSQQFLQQQGIQASDLARYEYLGRNDTVGTAVAAGDFDAGALDERTFRALVAAGEPLRELARFGNVSQPWVARSGLPDDITDALRHALLALDENEALDHLNISGFVPGDEQDYQHIHHAMEDNFRFFSDAQISAVATEPPVAAAIAEAPDTVSAPSAAAPAPTAPDALSITIRLPAELLSEALAEQGRGELVINLDFDQSAAGTAGHGVDVDVRLPERILSPTTADDP